MKCYICGFEMTDISACHDKCQNCGAEITCADL